IEQAERTIDKSQAEKMAQKFADQEDFTLEDFLEQMQQLKKMGSMKKMLMMMPGAQGMRQQLDQFDDSQVNRIEAIIRSMTPYERNVPKAINGSRRARIAAGSGVHVSEVNTLLERFREAQKMMKRMAAGGGMPGMPGMPGGVGAGRRNQRKGKGKNKKQQRFGNPARAEAEARKEQERLTKKASQEIGSAFGAGADPKDFDPAQLNLPKG